jgi:formylglycine-generating enzyme required for sulfatase activity
MRRLFGVWDSSACSGFSGWACWGTLVVMRCLVPTLLVLTLGCEPPPENKLAVDGDGDGFTEFEGDCDDDDPDTFPGAAEKGSADDCMTDSDGDGWGESDPATGVRPGTDCDDDDDRVGGQGTDGDCDALLTDDDCDDSDPGSTAIADDKDCDQVLTADDCDDADPDSTLVAQDGDCDGVLTAADCDDADPASPIIAEDGDCDGLPTEADCDDANASSTAVAEDADCDGLLTADDCDDGDPDSTGFATDADCDGTISSRDCDDGDASSTVTAEDGDCDGTLTAADCDDGESTSTVVAEDADCDGILTADDCDDDDPDSTDIHRDLDCDGTLGISDCDDEDPDSTVMAEDADCDGVLTAADCDDEDASTVYDMDCDGVLTADDCDDEDAASTIVSADGDCDGALTTDDCDDGDATSTVLAEDSDCDGREDYLADHGGRMLKIDAQTFEMGCTSGMSDCAFSESPAHFVTLTNDFYIGETEVTQGEYEAMMGTSPSYFSSCGTDCPVEYVSWYMSAAFANAVSDSEGLEQCYTCTGSGTSTSCSIAVEPYSCGGYRLATEAEWEAAARCGEDTLYAGSTVLGDVGWSWPIISSSPHSVATKASNACGLYDMSGNVWEWTQDWWDTLYYYSSPDTDPWRTGGDSGGLRIRRGGSWQGEPADARVSARKSSYPDERATHLGLRLVRTSP